MAREVGAVPDSHPRAESLRIRELLVEGVMHGITSMHGLIAHGRGEALDYLLGERTHQFAESAIYAASLSILSAEHPVISVNGNSVALVPSELVRLSKETGAVLEVNLFHRNDERLEAVARHLKDHGADRVLLPDADFAIHGLESDRRYVSRDGIWIADVVFVPLEDGDRCGALRSAGKDVITVDLNPLSRTSMDANISIVDNVVRALPLLVRSILDVKDRFMDKTALRAQLAEYDHMANLKVAESVLRQGIR